MDGRDSLVAGATRLMFMEAACSALIGSSPARVAPTGSSPARIPPTAVAEQAIGEEPHSEGNSSCEAGVAASSSSPQPRTAALFLAAATRNVSASPTMRLSKAVAQATAIAHSPHAQSVAACGDDSVRSAAHQLIVAQDAMRKANSDTPSKDEIFGELTRNFGAQKQDKTPAVTAAPLYFY